MKWNKTTIVGTDVQGSSGSRRVSGRSRPSPFWEIKKLTVKVSIFLKKVALLNLKLNPNKATWIIQMLYEVVFIYLIWIQSGCHLTTQYGLRFIWILENGLNKVGSLIYTYFVQQNLLYITLSKADLLNKCTNRERRASAIGLYNSVQSIQDA